MANMNKVEKLMKENEMLDRQLKGINKKKKENLVKVCGLIANAKQMRIEDYEVIGDNGQDDSPRERNEVNGAIEEEQRNDDENSQEVVIVAGDQSRRNGEGHPEGGNDVDVAALKREEKTLLEKIEESTKNLGDHKKLLENIEKENGRDGHWQAQSTNVQKYSILHLKYKESKERRINAIRMEFKRMESFKKREVKERFVINQGASTSSGVGSSTPRLRFAVKRKLNESVLDCGEIVKKIPAKEKEAMVPKVLKVEESPSEYPFDCSFASCSRSFTSAAPLASHLEKHYSTKQAKFDCPFPNCQFANTQEHLTKHMRSKHTKEQMFTCDHCSSKFHTMDAKVGHEKKHRQQDVWGQCDREDCLRFYQLARGHCRLCAKTK